MPTKAELEEKVDRVCRQIKTIRRRNRQLSYRLMIEDEDAFILVSRDEMNKLLTDAFDSTIIAHGPEIKNNWIQSFKKRFWGNIKTLVHNRGQ